jgi:uncharacterized membrane protein (UPF0127 family)
MFKSKTKNRKIRKWEIVFLLAIIFVALGIKAHSYYWPKAIIKIGGQELKVLVADNSRHMYAGWSNHKNMGKYNGMLFVFVSKSQHTMVMRNMNFPLDIVWIDGKVIVDIAPNLQPDLSTAEAELVPYFARLPSTFVLELPAGFTAKNGVKIGDSVEINL